MISSGVTEVILDKIKQFGNPSSLHSLGLAAEIALEQDKSTMLELLGGRGGDFIFTSGGTEANNLVIQGCAKTYGNRGKTIVTTSTEHASVIETLKHLEKQGFTVKYIRPDSEGQITPQAIADAVDDDTILVSLIHVCNETGYVIDIEAAAHLAKEKNSRLLFHSDGVQGFGKYKYKLKNSDIDFFTVSGHKIHAPKGVGGLYIKNKTRLQPIMFGGSQQKGIRPGTESTILTAAFAAAAKEIYSDVDASKKYYAELGGYARRVLTAIDGILVNSPEGSADHILNISTCKVKSETMLHFLEKEEIYISSGSACAKGAKSHVLNSMGLSQLRVATAIRISFAKHNTKQEIDILAQQIEKATRQLVNIS